MASPPTEGTKRNSPRTVLFLASDPLDSRTPWKPLNKRRGKNLGANFSMSTRTIPSAWTTRRAPTRLSGMQSDGIRTPEKRAAEQACTQGYPRSWNCLHEHSRHSRSTSLRAPPETRDCAWDFIPKTLTHSSLLPSSVLCIIEANVAGSIHRSSPLTSQHLHCAVQFPLEDRGIQRRVNSHHLQRLILRQ